MKTCVSTYSFGGYVDSLGILGVIDKAAEMGFDGIEFVEGGWTNGLDPEIAAQCRARAEEKGLAAVSYCVGANFLRGDAEQEVERVCREVDFAAALGVCNMRHDVASAPAPGSGTGEKWGIGYDDVLPRIADGIRRVAEYAAQKGVGTMTENHGYFSQDAARVEKLINTVNHPNFGALVDIGNFMCADERPDISVGLLSRYCKHVHCKDFHYKSGVEMYPGNGWFTTRGGNYLRGAILGSGVVPVAQCLRVLRNNGYDGYVSIEFEGSEDNLRGISWGLEFLRRCI